MGSEGPVIPLFPLEIVQFPGVLTPLHIFEPRYRKMLKDCLTSDKTFGIVYLNPQTRDASGLPPAGSVGCTVEVAVAQELSDGRSNILCFGKQRFRIVEFAEGEPYHQARVAFFEDTDSFDDHLGRAGTARALFHRMIEASRRLGGEAPAEGESPGLPEDPQALSLFIPSYFEIDNDEKQELLEMESTAARLDAVNSILEKTIRDLEARAFASQVAKTNGHAGKLPKF